MFVMLDIAGLLVGSYLLGALPFGLWVAWKLKGVDIRSVGSGNIGSTNVGRICGPAAGALVLVLDALKGLIPPLVGMSLKLESRWFILAALVAIIGHNYSIFLKFKGGKGISTSVGAMLGICPKVCLAASILFGAEVLTLRYVSLGSLIGAITLPIGMYIVYPGDNYRLGFGLIACIMAIYKHRANIQRLLAGTEPKVSLRRSKSGALRTPTGQVDNSEPDHSTSNAG
jgi:glycerol-3-phosphate acyltransferase PlsY